MASRGTDNSTHSPDYLSNKVVQTTWKSRWVIDKFSCQCHKIIRSAAFRVSGSEWRWSIYEKRQAESGVYLELTRVRNDSVLAVCNFWFSSDERRRRLVVRPAPSGDTASHFMGADSTVFEAFKPFLLDGALTVCFELTAYVPSSPELCEGVTKIQIRAPGIMDDLRRLRDSEESSDVVFVVGQKKLHAHKFVLAIRSPVFRVMFESDMKEKHENEVELTDVDAAVVDEFLTFIYTDSSPNIRRMAADLLLMADKYDVAKLREMCEYELASNLEVHTVVNVLRMANKLNATQLRNAAMEFIDFHSHKVRKTEGWKAMLQEEPQLLQDIYSAL